MDKYIETLDSLMKAKKEHKKKDPSLKEKEMFHKAWVNLAIGSGFAGRAEQYLYEGFAFCGAEPFFEYLSRADDPNATLTALFTGKYYGVDSNVTFRLVTHLLALLINNNSPKNVLAPVVKRLPGASYNKDKKRLGTAEKTMEKYFFSELKRSAVLLPLAEVGTKPAFIKEFIDIMQLIMDGIEKNGAAKGIVAENIDKVRDWLGAYVPPQKAAPENTISQEKTVSQTIQAIVPPISDVEKKPVAQTTPFPVTKPVPAPVTPPALETVDETPADALAYFTDLISKVSKAALAIKADSTQQKAKVDALTFALENEQAKLSQANQQIKEQAENIAILRQKLMSAEADNVVLRQTIESKNAIIAEKDAEISERVKMAEVLSRDRSKQGDELLQRMASEIRKECLDFYDAAGIPMSCELGEIMRDKLTAILAILEKGGMKIK